MKTVLSLLNEVGPEKPLLAQPTHSLKVAASQVKEDC